MKRRADGVSSTRRQVISEDSAMRKNEGHRPKFSFHCMLLFLRRRIFVVRKCIKMLDSAVTSRVASKRIALFWHSCRSHFCSEKRTLISDCHYQYHLASLFISWLTNSSVAVLGKFRHNFIVRTSSCSNSHLHRDWTI